MDVVLFAQ